MHTIWKYELKITDTNHVMMPEASKILTAQMQGNVLCIWAMVAPSSPLRERVIRIVGTGNPFRDAQNCRYIASVQERVFVWHVFEVL